MLRSPRGANGYARRRAGYVRRTWTASGPSGGAGRDGRGRPRLRRVVREPVHEGAERVPGVQRRRVVPALGEAPRQVVDRRAVELELEVVPGGLHAVVRVVELDDLGISEMIAIVSTAVTEVDAPDERDVARRVVVLDDDELLVMAPAPPDPMVEEHLSAGLVDVPGEREVLRLAEVDRLGM